MSSSIDKLARLSGAQDCFCTHQNMALVELSFVDNLILGAGHSFWCCRDPRRISLFSVPATEPSLDFVSDMMSIVLVARIFGGVDTSYCI